MGRRWTRSGSGTIWSAHLNATFFLRTMNFQ
jgi:hypothetical protein